MTTPAQGPVLSGHEWLDQFMQAQAELQAQQFFLMFSIGQLGALAKHEPERALEIIECIGTDIDDVESASLNLARVARNITANLRGNIETAST